MARLVQLRNYLLPAGIGIGLAIVAGWFYLGWLPSQQRYLDARNFRLLTTLSDQIGGSITNFDKMMDNAADSGVEAGHVHEIVRSLEEVDKEDVEHIGVEYHDPPRIMVRADEGSHFLYFAYKRQVIKPAKQYVLRTNLDKLIRNLLPPADRNPFDAILVARSDGEVVFQTAAPGVSITQIGDFKSQAQSTKSKPVEPINVKSFSEFSSLTAVSVANTGYRVYTEPLPLPLPPFLGEQKVKEAESGATKSTWIVLGMVRADQFRKECQAIPYRYFLWVSLLLVLAISATPFLKVFASAPAERLRARDVTAIAVMGCVASTAVTFMLLDSYHWQRGIEKRDEIRMRSLAREIDGSLGAEQEAAFEQLDKLWTTPQLGKALSAADGDKTRLIAQCESKGTCEKDLLAKQDLKLEFYNHPQMLIWSDETGQQVVKWTVKGHITPFLKLDDPSITYYPAVKRAFTDPMAAGPDPVYKQGIGAIYSPNTGENLTIFWKIETRGEGGTGGGKDSKKKYCASLATTPVSVICPILPADFQFAIIRPDGTVVYHSDRTRNLRENFFAEVDEDQEVRSRVAMKSEGALLTKYMGRSYRVYVHPMRTNAQESWTVVLLRDMRGEETMNLEVLSLATILFALYALALALALAWVHWSQRARRTRNWLWPDTRRARTYRQLAAINAVVIVGLLVLSEFRINLAVLLLIVCIPLSTMVYNFVALKRSPGSEPSKGEEKGESAFSWAKGYVTTFATLLAVVGMLPCLGFFKAAWEFEEKLLIERNQLQLTEDVSTRRQFVRSNYENVKGYEGIASEMEEPRPAESPSQATFFYKDEILKTEICRDAREPGRSAEPCGRGEFEEADSYEERFLGSISPKFNQIASEGRSMIQAATTNPKNSHWLLRRSFDGEDREHLEFTSYNGGGKTAAVSSVWMPLRMPPGDWTWWLGASLFGLLVYAAVSSTLEKIFELRMKGAETQEKSDPPRKPEDLPRNLLVVGPSSAIANLDRRTDVQARDLYQMLRAPMHKATAVGWSWSGPRSSKEPIEEVVRQLTEDGRTVVFRNFDRGPEQKMLSALETILARFHGPIIITSTVHPVSKAKEESRGRWEAALQTFVCRDVSSHPSWHVPESSVKIPDIIAEEAYYDWLLAGRDKEQKLLLAQVAEEKIVNPNSKAVTEELVNEGLLKRSHGMLEVFSGGFAKFLKYAIPRKEIQAWEKEGAGSQRASLRMSLLIAGAALALFLLYTQGALVQTWTQYLGAVGAAIAAVFKLINVIRQGGTTGTEAS
jgi:hypothetical protein